MRDVLGSNTSLGEIAAITELQMRNIKIKVYRESTTAWNKMPTDLVACFWFGLSTIVSNEGKR